MSIVGPFLMAALVWTVWVVIALGIVFAGAVIYFTARERRAARNRRSGHAQGREQDTVDWRWPPR